MDLQSSGFPGRRYAAGAVAAAALTLVLIAFGAGVGLSLSVSVGRLGRFSIDVQDWHRHLSRGRRCHGVQRGRIFGGLIADEVDGSPHPRGFLSATPRMDSWRGPLPRSSARPVLAAAAAHLLGGAAGGLAWLRRRRPRNRLRRPISPPTSSFLNRTCPHRLRVDGTTWRPARRGLKFPDFLITSFRSSWRRQRFGPQLPRSGCRSPHRALSSRCWEKRVNEVSRRDAASG